MTLPDDKTARPLWTETEDVFEAALNFQRGGLCIIPLRGKHPALVEWKQYQSAQSTEQDIENWHKRGLLRNIGVVCGAVSDNTLVIDFDGPGGYPAFAATFPHLVETFTVATGGGIGKHVYLQVEQIPSTAKAMNTPIGNIELRSDGAYVVAPPSRHPQTQQLYRIEKNLPILRVQNLEDVTKWLMAFVPVRQITAWQPPREASTSENGINPKIIEAITEDLLNRGAKQQKEWLNCSCIYPERHKHGDRNPSFGFNLESGYGYCYGCGTILARDICDRLGIDPRNYGGVLKLAATLPTIQPDHQKAHAVPTSELPPPDKNLPSITEIPLPDWLTQYTIWASRAGNQTPVMFHQASGIWLLAVAIARRLVVQAPWGIRLFPNLYMMFVADTTFYRKTTAFKLAESVIRDTIPHMLMPTPGSPERFQEALAGRMPGNYKELTYAQQEILSKGRAFAAQRGLFKDEVAGLFGAFNRKDYMQGMKDLIMELYDCPDYADKDTQTGLTIVQNAALSILGVTTPAGLSAGTTLNDWDNGLLPRFLLLTPEPNYLERPTLDVYEPAPSSVIDGLKAIYERLPQPAQEGEIWKSPQALKVDMKCWSDVQAYSDRLRKLCDPHRETPLDDRLKGLYGRMHVQGVKLATILAALDWMQTETPAPVITRDNWQLAELMTEHWRASAHRLLDHLDRNGSGREERRQQDRVLEAIRGAGPSGITLRRMYRNLNLRSADARQIVQELVRDGQVAMTMIGSAESCMAVQWQQN
jgi:hypothetical protein